MHQTQLYTILHRLNGCIEVINSVVKQDKGKLSGLINEASDHIGGAFACIEAELSDRFVEVAVPSPEVTEKPKEPKKEKPSNAELLEQAYEILKTESKPGVVLIQNEMKITQALSRKLFKKLLESGRIVKGKRAVDLEVETEGTDSEDVKVESEVPIKKVDPNRPKVMDLVDKLPTGNDLLVHKHLQSLIALPRVHRAIYLTGLDLKDQFTSDDVARATANGVDRTLVDEIVELQKTKPIKVNDSELITISKDGNLMSQKYFAMRTKCVLAINEKAGKGIGAELYRHMAKWGVTTRLLVDFKYIAKQYVEGKV